MGDVMTPSEKSAPARQAPPELDFDIDWTAVTPDGGEVRVERWRHLRGYKTAGNIIAEARTQAGFLIGRSVRKDGSKVVEPAPDAVATYGSEWVKNQLDYAFGDLWRYR